MYELAAIEVFESTEDVVDEQLDLRGIEELGKKGEFAEIGFHVIHHKKEDIFL